MRPILLLLLALLPLRAAEEKLPPNVILIFADDLGYNDLSCFGSEKIKTPNLDQMATEGRRFTNFMVASSVCTPSRAALLTGSYPKRVSLHQHVLFPFSKKGLNPAELTLAKHFKSAGYATAAFGKWHLGHYPETLPTAHGFDTYLGIPYSNDMSHPDNKGKPKRNLDAGWKNQAENSKTWNTPLVRDTELVELPVDQRFITRRYTDEAIAFIEKHQKEPFFIYLPHSMPHIPLFVPDEVADPDPANAYINVIEHIDAQIGRVIATLREKGLAENTLVIFTSDNGPWLQFKNHAGSALPLREGKGTPFEGGQRVPCIMWAPSRIPPGTTSAALLSTIDLLPSLASLIEKPLPENLKIDGLDLSPTFFSDAENGRPDFLYYSPHGELNGIRQGPWKLLVDPNGAPKGTYLFNLVLDLGEKENLAKDKPEIIAELTARMKLLDQEITENQRPAWTTDKPHPWPDKL